VALPIRYSHIAEAEELELLLFINNKWGKQKAEEIYNKIELVLYYISLMPKMYPVSQQKQGLRKCVLSKQTSIYYRIKEDFIEIVSIRDNRAYPKF